MKRPMCAASVVFDTFVEEHELLISRRLISVRSIIEHHVHLPVGVAALLHLVDPLVVGARLFDRGGGSGLLIG